MMELRRFRSLARLARLARLALLLAGLCLAAPALRAEPDRATILLGSYHLGAPDKFESFNPGVFLTWERRRVDLTAGIYRNSYGRPSLSGMVDLPLYRGERLTASAFLGLSHYPGDGDKLHNSFGDVVPIGGLRLRAGRALLTVIPSDGSPVDAIISLGVIFPLD